MTVGAGSPRLGRDGLAEPAPTIPCPICQKTCELAGPGGVMLHVLDDHPTTDLAANIRIELAYFEGVR